MVTNTIAPVAAGNTVTTAEVDESVKKVDFLVAVRGQTAHGRVPYISVRVCICMELLVGVYGVLHQCEVLLSASLMEHDCTHEQIQETTHSLT